MGAGERRGKREGARHCIRGMGTRRHVVVALFALIPAASTWWFGQTLIALADDPALPERLMAGRGKTVLICAVSLALLFTFGFEHLAWSLPLLIVARMCAAYTIRKALYR